MKWWENLDRPCLGRDREMFFPSNRAGERVAQAFCHDCPVRKECLEDAMEREGNRGVSGRFGVFGGLSAEERHALYKARRRPPLDEAEGA